MSIHLTTDPTPARLMDADTSAEQIQRMAADHRARVASLIALVERTTMDATMKERLLAALHDLGHRAGNDLQRLAWLILLEQRRAAPEVPPCAE